LQFQKGNSAHQLHRILEVQYKTAWFLAHRIREAMRDGSLAPMGGAGAVVEGRSSKRVGTEFASHDTIRHGEEEYVRYDGARTDPYEHG
jgi:hypothetical protein